MRYFFKLVYLSGLILSAVNPATFAAEKADFFAGQDIHLAGDKMTVSNTGQDQQVLIFDGDFSLEIGDSSLSSDESAVWIETQRFDYRGTERVDYKVRVYLQGSVKVSQGHDRKLNQTKEVIIENGKSLVVHFFVGGEIFATANERSVIPEDRLDTIPVFMNAKKAMTPVRAKLKVAPEAMVPSYKNEISMVDEKFGKPVEHPLKVSDYFEIDKIRAMSQAEPGVIDPNAPQPVADSNGMQNVAASEKPKGQYRYPVNISGLLGQKPQIRVTELEDGSKVATIIGRFYLWQKKNEKGDMLEFQADNGVMFIGDGDFSKNKPQDGSGRLAGGNIDAVYLRGNIIATEEERTIRAHELFFDFVNNRALAIKAEMQTFDTERSIPVYVRAAKIQQVYENVFKAENIVLTSSEFYAPQVSMTASQLVMTDLRGVDKRVEGLPADSEFDVVIRDVQMKAGDFTYFAWPKIRTNLERPDVPIRRIHVGNDSDFGTFVETRWYLSRVLGLREPEGVDSSLLLDYFGERGTGAGVVIDYIRPDYFGGIGTYIIDDRGQDDLGRTSNRKNLEPEADIRGRITARHRHYLPYNWQATLEVGYLSDEHFLESYYRSEFNDAKAQETLLHLKRLQDNWAFSFLSKVRINDFQSELEELPTAEFHYKGVSLWNQKLTYYGDTQLSRLRNRLRDDSTSNADQDFFTYFTTRHELDMPLRYESINFVPFAATTYSVDDSERFDTLIDNNPSPDPQSKVLLSEIGLRTATMFWKDDPTFRSKFWDVDGLRHIIRPHAETMAYFEDEDEIEMRNVANVGISQRWETRRGPASRRRTLDWMRLDVDATFLSDTQDSSISNAYGPAKFIWNDPAIPVFTRRDTTLFGMVRDSINADYIWRMTDTTTILSDMNFDTEAGKVQQYNIGIAKYVYPDISYYIGSRYLRPVIVSVPDDDIFERGSNSLIGSITYAINNRYTLILSEEYNFDYEKNVRTEVALLRRYHRVFYGLTLSIDESREENSIVFSIWPQGVKDLTFGERKLASFRDGILEN